jgi:hypothetical protein
MGKKKKNSIKNFLHRSCIQTARYTKKQNKFNLFEFKKLGSSESSKAMAILNILLKEKPHPLS